MVAPGQFNATFPNPLVIRAWSPVELDRGGYNTQQYTLQEPFVFAGPLGSFIVPAGFQTDFASIPRAAFWWMDPEDPAILFASIAHDWAYANSGRVSETLTLTRAQADECLDYGMKVAGARWDQRKVVLAAVRIGGAAHWNPSPLAA